MRYKLILVIFVLGSLALLSGCAGLNSSFGCNATAGDNCSTVDRVNHQAMVGAYDNALSQAQRLKTPGATRGLVRETTRYNVKAPTAGEPVRYGESIQRIWIAPYEDQAGIYHEPSYVYTVLKGPHWVGLPVDQIHHPQAND